jgi:hypothetical protein
MVKEEVLKDYKEYSSLNIANAVFRNKNTLTFDDNQMCRSATLTGPTLTLATPFSFKVQGKTHTFSKISFVHPCPVEIESERHPAAMLLLADSFVSIIPLKEDNSGTQSQLFIDRVAYYIGVSPLNTLTVATGQDWGLQSIVAKNSAYFMWYEAGLNRIVESDTPDKRVLGWESNTIGGIDYICFKNPMNISSVALTYVKRLDPSPPHKYTSKLYYTPMVRSKEVSVESNVIPIKYSRPSGMSSTKGWIIFGFVVAGIVGVGILYLIYSYNIIPFVAEKMKWAMNEIATLIKTLWNHFYQWLMGVFKKKALPQLPV